MTKLRIGMVGAGGTGKTTTAQLLAKVLDIPFAPSVSRGVFKDWGINEVDQRNMTPRQTLDLQLEIYRRRLEQEEVYRDRSVVFDRTLIDHMIYCLYRCYALLTEEKVKELEAQMTASLHTYDEIIYFPIRFPVKDDGMRENNYAYRRIFDQAARGYLSWMDQNSERDISWGYVPSGTAEQAVEKIMIHLRRMHVIGKGVSGTESSRV